MEAIRAIGFPDTASLGENNRKADDLPNRVF